MRKIVDSGLTVVIVGNFTPTIFQPSWFAAQEMIRAAEAQAAKIDLIHENLTSFSTDWFQLQVTEDKFSISASTAHEDLLYDLVSSCFSLLAHTPVRLLGLNSHSHVQVEMRDEWHAIGDALVPKNMWNGILKEPGMRSLSVEGARTDGNKGYILVTVAPSRRFDPGIFVQINDHFELEQSASTDKLLKVLDTSWKHSLALGKNILDSVIKL